jgi:hypothetical protein
MYLPGLRLYNQHIVSVLRMGTCSAWLLMPHLQIASENDVNDLLTQDGEQVSVPLSRLFTASDLTPVTFKVLMRGGGSSNSTMWQSWIMHAKC